MEKLQRDGDQYVVFAMTALTTAIGNAFPPLLQKVYPLRHQSSGQTDCSSE